MDFLRAAAESLNKNKKWIMVGAIVYLLPVIYRFATENSLVPLLDDTLFLYHRDSQITPINLDNLRTFFVIPSAIGAIVGASFLENIFERRFSGLEKYLARLFGSLSVAFAWIIIEFVGYSFFNPVGPWGNTILSPPAVYARNLLIALVVAPLVPYLIEYVYRRAKLK